MAHLLACNVACLVIAALYYSWRDVYLHRRKREQLHERVSYMLWVAAQRAGGKLRNDDVTLGIPHDQSTRSEASRLLALAEHQSAELFVGAGATREAFRGRDWSSSGLGQ